MPKREDTLLVDDIYQSGLKIQLYTQGYTFFDFENDQRTVDAVIRNFEIIGEASRNLTADFQHKHPSIPWRDIINYRNLLIHGYFGISLKAVWNVIQDDLPLLMKNIASIKND